MQVVISVVDQKQRPVLPSSEQLPGVPMVCHAEYVQLLQQCWDTTESSRPTFDKVIAKLR